MVQIFLRFYEELNDFLPPGKKKREFCEKSEGPKTIKQVINLFGIPDSVVDLVLVNSRSVPFSYLISDGDRISVYPKFESFDISAITKLRAKPLRSLEFILDVHLGKLARYLRMLGFDALYRKDYTDFEIIYLSKETGRIILTRDLDLLKSKHVSRGYLIKNTDLSGQIKEVIERFNLLSLINPFSLCLCCNSKVQKIDKEYVRGKISPEIYSDFNEFSICIGCGKIFWKGSHYQSMLKFIEQIKIKTG